MRVLYGIYHHEGQMGETIVLKAVRQMTFGVIIGLFIGLWFGVNIGKEKPLFSNPFAEENMQQKAKRKAEEVYKDTKDAIREQLK